MFETNIVVVGNVLTAPEWRRTGNQALVANFRVASTARRFDRDSGRWVDGNHLRLRVNCWRRLAEGVGASITVGDPVVVVGRLYTRDWTDQDGNLRTSYEMEAVAVGHDLARGKGKFFRARPTTAISEADDPDANGQVRGERAELLTEREVPAAYGEGIPDEEEPMFVEGPPLSLDPVGALLGLAGPRQVADADSDSGSEAGSDPDSGSDSVPDSDEPDGSGQDGSDDPGSDAPEMEIQVKSLGGDTPGRRRTRRSTKREPVPA